MRRAMQRELAAQEASLPTDDTHVPGLGESEVGQATGNPNQWADRRMSEIQFGYDADTEVEQWWSQTGSKLSMFSRANTRTAW